MKTDFEYQINEYMVYCHSRQLRPKTMMSYEATLRLFEKWCKDVMKVTDLAKVNESMVRKYITHLQERGKYTFYSNDKKKGINCPERRRDYDQPLSVVCINNYLRNLKVFFHWLEEDFVISKDPTKKIKLLKHERKAKEYMNDEDCKKLMSKFNKSYYPEYRDFAITMLLMDTGMRLGECCCLKVDDIDLKGRSILLKAEITKGRQDRVVFFSAKTEIHLRRWLHFKDRYVESDALFPMKHNGEAITISAFERNFKGYLNRADIKGNYSPHCLRNNFAKRCLMNGMDIYTLSRILGHSSVTVTEKAYLDLTDEDLCKRYQSFSPVSSIF